MSRNDNLSVRINTWFYAKDHGVSPAMTVCIIADEFDGRLEDMGLELSMKFGDVRTRICDAVCTLFRAALEGKQVRGPARIPGAPYGWNDDTETIWEDFIANFYLDDKFWTDFWASIDEGAWEHTIPRFRAQMQSILPLYVQRDLALLEEKGLIVQNKEGEYINPEDDEYEEDSRDREGY